MSRWLLRVLPAFVLVLALDTACGGHSSAAPPGGAPAPTRPAHPGATPHPGALTTTSTTAPRRGPASGPPTVVTLPAPPTRASASPVATRSGSASPSSASGSSPTGASPPAAAPDIPWLPPGPASEGNPPPQQWYQTLQGHRCAAIANQIPEPDPTGDRGMFRALALACLAAPRADDPRWAEVGRLSRGMPSFSDCLEHAAGDLLRRILTVRAQFPGQPVRFAPPPAGGFACPFGFEWVELLGDPQAAACGPVTGGTDILLVGPNLIRPTTVTVGGVTVPPADVSEYGRDRIQVKTPPAPAGRPGPVPVVLTLYGRRLVAPGRPFTYVADPGQCPPR